MFHSILLLDLDHWSKFFPDVQLYANSSKSASGTCHLPHFHAEVLSDGNRHFPKKVPFTVLNGKLKLLSPPLEDQIVIENHPQPVMKCNWIGEIQTKKYSLWEKRLSSLSKLAFPPSTPIKRSL